MVALLEASPTADQRTAVSWGLRLAELTAGIVSVLRVAANSNNAQEPAPPWSLQAASPEPSNPPCGGAGDDDYASVQFPLLTTTMASSLLSVVRRLKIVLAHLLSKSLSSSVVLVPS